MPISPRVARDRCRHVLFSRKLLLATYGAHALCTHCRRHQMLMCTSVCLGLVCLSMCARTSRLTVTYLGIAIAILSLPASVEFRISFSFARLGRSPFRFGPASHQATHDDSCSRLVATAHDQPRKTTTRASDVSVVAGTIAIEATLPMALLPTLLARLEQPASRTCFGRLAPR